MQYIKIKIGARVKIQPPFQHFNSRNIDFKGDFRFPVPSIKNSCARQMKLRTCLNFANLRAKGMMETGRKLVHVHNIDYTKQPQFQKVGM